MFTITTLSLIRMGFAAIIGLIIARRLRNPVRVFVTRATPMQRRMSEDFFHRLTRITTPIGLLIALGTAILVNWGLLEAGRALHIVEQHEMTPLTQPAPWPENRYEAPAVTEFDLIPRPAAEPPPPDVQAPEILEPQDQATPKPADRETPKPGYPETVAPRYRDTDFYLQIFAFQSLTNARAQLAAWTGRLGYAQSPNGPLYCRLAQRPGDPAPYKILIGPFAGRQQAMDFRRQLGIAGFPRTTGDMWLWE